ILSSGIPPAYDDIRAYERALPQHQNPFNASSSDPPRKYVRFAGHIWGHGLNNVLQEALLMSYVAYAAQRSYVFEDYTWSHSIFPYTIYDMALRPSRIPLNAFISGPTAGGHFPGFEHSLLAVSAEYWNEVCPKNKRYVIDSRTVPKRWEGEELVHWWVERLRGIPAECVEVSDHELVFDFFVFGESRFLSLWLGLSTSPMLRFFSWSPLVEAAVIRNSPMLAAPHSTSPTDAAARRKGLVAVHIRRGDYSRHCYNLVRWHSSYMGMHQLPTLPDLFDVETLWNGTAAGDEEAITEERTQAYLTHCYPDIEQIVERLRTVRHESSEKMGADLRRVYILTNGWAWFMDGVRKRLLEDGWDDVKGSWDLMLDSEQQYVDMAVDMAIAENAEVFVGNGFSSLTSNIVMLRLSKGMDVNSIRF
ncbi:hypothetical protein FISHEDRAFT_15814, partial [Fistulina hepatica ATCC 64428]